MPAGRRRFKLRVKSKAKTPQPKDYGTSERWQHTNRTFSLVKPDDGVATYVARVMNSDILDDLFEAHLINELERCAGMRLKADFHDAAMNPHVTSSYKPRSNVKYNPYASMNERTDQQEEAYMRWHKALLCVELRNRETLINSVCFDISPRSVATLQLGLRQLHSHYLTA